LFDDKGYLRKNVSVNVGNIRRKIGDFVPPIFQLRKHIVGDQR
jgi:hypothetical protein